MRRRRGRGGFSDRGAGAGVGEPRPYFSDGGEGRSDLGKEARGWIQVGGGGAVRVICWPVAG